MKNLLGRLMSRPVDELRAIAGSWATITRDPNPSQNDLAIAVYHTMVDPSAMRTVWEGLDLEERAFLGWLLNQRNMLALADDLPAHLDRPLDEVTALVERLRRLGIVDVDEVMVRGSRVVSSGDNLYAWASRNQPEAVPKRVVSIATEAAKVMRDIIEESRRPAPFDEPLSALLDKLEQADVQRIAAGWKLPDSNRYYKSELIGVMNEFVATGQVRILLAGGISPAGQGLYSYLEGEGGRATAGQIKKQFSWGDRELRAAASGLIQRGLVWDVLEGERRFLFIPADMLKGAQSGPAVIAPHMKPRLDAPPPHSSLAKLPYEMPWDLLTLLAEATPELQLTLQDQRITKRLAKKINESFLHPEDMKTGTDYIDMVVRMARTLGLLHEKQGEQPALALTSKVDEWTRLSFESQRRRLFGLWQEDRKWAEPATYGTIYWWNSDLTGARKRLVKQVASLPVGQWISLDGFLRLVHLSEPFIIWDQDELVRRFGLRALQGFRSHWFEIEGRIVADMVRTMLYWLGVVEIGRDKQKRFVAFRLLEDGLSLLDPERRGPRTERAQPAAAKPLLVQPNFEVLVLQPESRVLWTLMRSADLVRHDRVSVYVLNKESVLRAVEGGIPPADLSDFLEESSGRAVPQNVVQSIGDWGRMIRYASVRRCTLIEVQDPAVLDEMVASRKTRKYISRRLSPTAAIAELPDVGDTARDDPWQRLMKELRAAGYVPKFVSELIESEDEPSTAEKPKTVATSASVPTATGAATVARKRRATSRREQDAQSDAANGPGPLEQKAAGS